MNIENLIPATRVGIFLSENNYLLPPFVSENWVSFSAENFDNEEFFDIYFLDSSFISYLNRVRSKYVVLCDFLDSINSSQFKELCSSTDKTLFLTKSHPMLNKGIEIFEILPPSVAIVEKPDISSFKEIGYLSGEFLKLKLPNEAKEYRDMKTILAVKPDLILVPCYNKGLLPLIVASMAVGSLIVSEEAFPKDFGIEQQDEYVIITNTSELHSVFQLPFYFKHVRFMAHLRASSCFNSEANLKRLALDIKMYS